MPGHAVDALSSKQRSSALGRQAEGAVASHLEALGLEILSRNLRIGHLELDLVARDGRVIAVVEVRLRGPSAWVRALDSVDARKRARIRAAGEALWAKQFSSDARVDRMRFDIASVTFTAGVAEIEIVRAAF